MIVLILLIIVGAVYGGAKIVKAGREKPVNLQTSSSSPGNSSDTVTICTTVGGCDKSTPKASTLSTPATTTAPQSSNDSTTSGCTTKTLPIPPATYEDTSLLPQGQTQQTTPGVMGYESICNGKTTVITHGIAPIIFVGTGTSSGSSTSQGSTTGTSSNNNGLTESQAAQQCDDNLANGADSSDPQAYLDQCMHQYGY